jgi:integrase
MTAPKRRKARANGEGTIYKRKDGRWEAAGYVLAAHGSRKRVRVYGTTRRETAVKLAEKIARLTAKDVRTFLDRLRTTCQCCAQGLDTERKQCCAVGNCCNRQLSPSTVTYVHSVLKSALEHAVREDELPRNVARNVKAATPRPRRFRPLTAGEARQFLNAASTDRLHALYELALRTGLRKGELLGLRWEDLDLNGGSASIRRSLQRTRTGGLTHLPTKTRASERRIAPSRMPPLPQGAQGSTGRGKRNGRASLESQRPRLHHPDRRTSRPGQPHPPLPQLP